MNGLGKILEPFKGVVAPGNKIFEIYMDGYQICRFDKATGILEISISPEDIESFLIDYRMPMNGLTLPLPNRRSFEGVRKIKNIPPKNGGKYYFGYQRPYLSARGGD